MALPVILIDAATGSDSLASGAGPGTAVTGTAAATDATNGRTLTLTDSVDISAIATDGSAAIYVVDATAGHRNFDSITGVIANGVTGGTVTVTNGFTTSLSGKSWAVGGKRASLASATSLKLVDNNAGNGDAMPGWVLQLQSGHTETMAASVNLRRAGSTAGLIALQGASGAATVPVLTFSNNGDAFIPRGAWWLFQNFEMQNSNGTKTASNCFDVVGVNLRFKNIKVNHTTNKFNHFYVTAGGGSMTFEDCNIQYCNSSAILFGIDSPVPTRFFNNYIANNGSHGISFAVNGQFAGLVMDGNVFAYNAGDGVNVASMTNTTLSCAWYIKNNVFHGNTSDGFECTSTSASGDMFFYHTMFENNRFTQNGAYGVNFSGSGITDVFLNGHDFIMRNNNFFGNTTDKYNPNTLTISLNEVTADPSGGLSTSTKDYTGATGGSNFMSAVSKGLGYPIGGTLAVGTGSSSYAYNDMGLQHQDSATGGGGMAVPPIYGELV